MARRQKPASRKNAKRLVTYVPPGLYRKAQRAARKAEMEMSAWLREKIEALVS